MKYLRVLTNRRTSRFTLFPYTTLFRSGIVQLHDDVNLAFGAGEAGVQDIPRWLVGAAHGHRADGFRRKIPGERRQQCATQYRSEEHTSELQSRQYLVCRLLLEKKNSIF